MNVNKLILRKKWWNVCAYQIYDGQSQNIGYCEKRGLISPTTIIYNQSGVPLMQLKKHWATTSKFEFLKDNAVIARFKANWTMTKFFLEVVGVNDTFELRKKDWGKRITLWKNQQEEIGLISSASFSFNEVGVVAKDFDPLILVGCLVAIRIISTQGAG